jgi:sugar/nucleoside kinase (ribokinase family)
VQPIAVVGNLTRDVVAGSPPRAGGPPYYAARVLARLDRPALVVAKCAADDEDLLVEPLRAHGVPVEWLPAASSAAFSFSYDGDVRRMRVDAVGEPWSQADATAVGEASAVHVGALFRDEFPVETLAALGRGRLLSLDGQGLVRAPSLGPLVLEPGADRDALAHVDVLKLAVEEAEALVGGMGEEAIAALGVAEVIVTSGSSGAWVYAEGSVGHVPPHPLVPDADPTGAGDGFAAAYLAARADGVPPLAAAESASAVVAELLQRAAR